jgi:bilirubin oxidase
VKSKQKVSFIARFADYADSLHPFMYHCHIALHEDEGMMGQFLVENEKTGINNISYPKPNFSLFPNPTNNKLMINFDHEPIDVYYITITDILGRTYFMLPKPRFENGIDISTLKPGNYFLNLTDNSNKQTYTRSFVKQ